MNGVKYKVKMLHPMAVVPRHATQGSAAADLVTVEACNLYPGERRVLGLGFAVELPGDWCMRICGRSGNFIREGLRVEPGIVDSDYRGEVGVMVHNVSDTIRWIPAGTRIAQAVLEPTVWHEPEVVGELSETKRGGGGFGSTGK